MTQEDKPMTNKERHWCSDDCPVCNRKEMIDKSSKLEYVYKQNWEDDIKDLAFELLGNIEYGDTRDNPKWRKMVLEGAERKLKTKISQLLKEEEIKSFKAGFNRGVKENCNTEELLKEERENKSPMGVSQWKEHGKKYRYWDFWKERIVQEEKEKTIEECADAIPLPEDWHNWTIERQLGFNFAIEELTKLKNLLKKE